jgi:6-phosphogluconolactonase (cycloisomerase 2 family)
VYPIDGQGDLTPLHVIQGPKTELDWPIGMAVDPDRRELYVANDVGDSILVFPIDANGDTPPIRKIQGSRSRVKNPTGLFLDRKNDELWVSNFGSHSLTVFKPTANGDVAPLRVIRSAPADQPSLMIGNPGAFAYDTKREQLLVAN